MSHPTGHARFTPGAVTVDIGRGSVVSVVLAVLLLAAFSAAGVYAGLKSEGTVMRAIGWAFGGLFAILFLYLVINLPKIMRPRGLVIDGRGVHTWHGEAWVLVPWQQIAAVGIGYEEPPEGPTLPASVQDAVKDKFTDAVMSSLKMDNKRRVAAEIFPARPDLPAMYPGLAMYRKELAPPDPRLPAVRWRILLPETRRYAEAVEHGVRTFAPNHWFGWFARPFSAGLRMK